MNEPKGQIGRLMKIYENKIKHPPTTGNKTISEGMPGLVWFHPKPQYILRRQSGIGRGVDRPGLGS